MMDRQNTMINAIAKRYTLSQFSRLGACASRNDGREAVLHLSILAKALP